MFAEPPPDDFIALLERNGGRAIRLSEDLGRTAPLPPLKFQEASRELVVLTTDIRFIAEELGEVTRVVPEFLFTAPSVLLLDTGLPVVDGAVSALTWRNRKFLDKARSRGDAVASWAPASTDKPALLLGPIEFRNYSHWVFEALPKLGLYRAAFGADPEDVLVNHKTGFHVASLAMFAPGTRVNEVQAYPARCANVAFTTSLARSVSHLNPSVFAFYDALPRLPRGDLPRRILVSRAKAEHRRITNEAVLAARLERYGFATLALEDLSFERQVALFQNAEIVVSPHGAGLANLAFCRDCRLVVEILSAGFRDASAFAHACRHKGVPYLAASGVPVRPVKGTKGPETWPGHASFTLDVDRFLAGLIATLRDLDLPLRPVGAGAP